MPRCRSRTPDLDPRTLYPLDPDWLVVQSKLSVNETILVSLCIDPRTIRALVDQTRADAVDPLDPFSGHRHQLDSTAIDLGSLQGEYDRRIALMLDAVDSGLLPTLNASGQVVDKTVALNWLMAMGWHSSEPASQVMSPSSPTRAPQGQDKATRKAQAPEAPLDPETNLRIERVMALTGLARSTIYSRMAKGKFPQSRHLEGITGWRYGDIIEWLNGSRHE